MAINIRFAFVCQKRWQELTGSDPVHRFCDDCRREIINLDPLSDGEREKIFRDAIRTGNTPCVFATVPMENVNACRPASPFDLEEEIPMLGGEPIIDEDDLSGSLDDYADDDVQFETDVDTSS